MLDEKTHNLSYIADCIIEQGGVVSWQEKFLKSTVAISLADGKSISFYLLIRENGNKIQVQEDPSFEKRLPCSCPERHINGDGSFCLFWDNHESIHIIDKSSAQEWTDILYKFLMTQERVTRKKVWPGNSWAHGNAAGHQLQALKAAEALGSDFLEDIQTNKFHIKYRLRRSSQGNDSLILVYRNNKELYRVWANSKRVIRLRQPCICKDSKKHSKQLRSCRNHAQMAAELAISLWNWEQEEKRFWESYADRKCCETMEHCPLKKTKQGDSQTY